MNWEVCGRERLGTSTQWHRVTLVEKCVEKVDEKYMSRPSFEPCTSQRQERSTASRGNMLDFPERDSHPEGADRQHLRRFYSYACITDTPVGVWAAIAQSVQRLATDWTVRGSNPRGGATFSAPVQTGPATHPASCTMDIGSLPVGKAAGAWG
jgi:hypothetical protein